MDLDRATEKAQKVAKFLKSVADVAITTTTVLGAVAGLVMVATAALSNPFEGDDIDQDLGI